MRTTMRRDRISRKRIGRDVEPTNSRGRRESSARREDEAAAYAPVMSAEAATYPGSAAGERVPLPSSRMQPVSMQPLQLAHGTLPLPTFLPDATLGVVRAVD